MTKYIAAVSGGPDSMAMLDIYKKDISLVCHVNYQKRPSADRDTMIVKKYCDKYHLKFKLLKVTPAMYKKYKQASHNFQTVARLIRYNFFNTCTKLTQTNNLMVAHNQDDFVETALMQTKRHSLTLHYGINTHSIYKDIKIYRPLINKRKVWLQTYCDTKHIPYGLDETNELDIYERNVIRKQLKQLTPLQFNRQYNHFVKINKINEVLMHKVQIAYQLWKHVHWLITAFNNIEPKVQIHLIYEFIRLNTEISNIGKAKIDLIIDFIKKGKNNGKLRLGNNYFLTKDVNNIHIIKDI